MEQIILTNIDENKIDMEATGLEQKEILYIICCFNWIQQRIRLNKSDTK